MPSLEGTSLSPGVQLGLTQSSPVFMKLPVWLCLRPLDFLHRVFHLLSVLTIFPCSPSLQQKRDIQLLKAYMRAIRSVNPNLQNLEETIEYNEILE